MTSSRLTVSCDCRHNQPCGGSFAGGPRGEFHEGQARRTDPFGSGVIITRDLPRPRQARVRRIWIACGYRARVVVEWSRCHCYAAEVEMECRMIFIWLALMAVVVGVGIASGSVSAQAFRFGAPGADGSGPVAC